MKNPFGRMRIRLHTLPYLKLYKKKWWYQYWNCGCQSTSYPGASITMYGPLSHATTCPHSYATSCAEEIDWFMNLRTMLEPYGMSLYALDVLVSGTLISGPDYAGKCAEVTIISMSKHSKTRYQHYQHFVDRDGNRCRVLLWKHHVPAYAIWIGLLRLCDILRQMDPRCRLDVADYEADASQRFIEGITVESETCHMAILRIPQYKPSAALEHCVSSIFKLGDIFDKKWIDGVSSTFGPTAYTIGPSNWPLAFTRNTLEFESIERARSMWLLYRKYLDRYNQDLPDMPSLHEMEMYYYHRPDAYGVFTQTYTDLCKDKTKKRHKTSEIMRLAISEAIRVYCIEQIWKRLKCKTCFEDNLKAVKSHSEFHENNPITSPCEWKQFVNDQRELHQFAIMYFTNHFNNT